MKQKQPGLKRANLYISRNENALREELEQVREYVKNSSEPAPELKVFDAADRSVMEEFESFASSPSLFSGQKVAVLENIDRASAAFQKIAAGNIPEDRGADVIYIFTAASEKINRSLKEQVKKHGIVRKIRPPTGGDLLKWLDERSASDGINFTAEARTMLVEDVNLDMDRLKREYEKLSCYISSEEKKVIEADTVKYLVSRVYSMKIFDLVDYLGKRDRQGSLEALEDILKVESNLIGLTTLVHRMFKSMLYIKTERGKGSVTDYLSRNINMPSYFISRLVSKYIRFSNNYSMAEMIQVMDMLNDYDIEMRKNTVQSGRLVQSLIVRITGPGADRKA